MNGQEYLLVSYADASKELEWHPKSNLRNSEQLIQEFKSKSKIKSKVKNINHIQQHEETPKYSALSMVRLISDFDDVSIDTEVKEEVEEIISKCNILPEDTSQEVIYSDDDNSIMNTDSGIY
ncbi:hypothetical protein Glove_66g55 [Diversispora epigaea]|uniref:Uncharacterized protein n=1 Tax=Diversispora epigaea TaxID=1348612 RepID=A0A397JAP0_9GLOM|nr:hypothetical protein Glove_66g55 [Diversispora epigaea]